MTQPHPSLLFSQEVLDARAAGKAIVALESTIISHGMPYPQNVEMAREVEQLIRDGGAVPATIAIIDGRICIGLSPEQLELLAHLARRHEGQPPRPALRAVAKETGRHHGGRHHDLRRTGRHSRVRHRRHRRRAPRRGNQLRYFGRPAGTGADLGGRRLRRREIDPRYRPDPGIPGNPWRAGDQRGPGRLSRLLYARKRLQGRFPPRQRRPSKRHSLPPNGSWA